MNLSQLAVAAGAESKWLLNSSALLGKPVRPSAGDARWWALVRTLTGIRLPLKESADTATRVLAQRIGFGQITGLRDDSHSTAVVVDLRRFESVFLANLSRAIVMETPKRRGRHAARVGDPIRAAARYGIDIGLIRSSLKRTPAKRLALLDANVAFLYQMQRGSR